MVNQPGAMSAGFIDSTDCAPAALGVNHGLELFAIHSIPALADLTSVINLGTGFAGILSVDLACGVFAVKPESLYGFVFATLDAGFHLTS